jgi:hypothetical protein
VISLLLSLTPWYSNNSIYPISDALYNEKESDGPVFELWMPNFVDLVPGTGSINLTLELAVVVTDTNGIDTVIGSYKNQSESVWKNVTLALNQSYPIPDYYAGHARYFTLDDEHSGIVWDVKFYANDSLGNWNTSNTTFVSIWRPNLAPAQSELGLMFLMWWFSISIVITSLIGLVIIQYRRYSSSR